MRNPLNSSNEPEFAKFFSRVSRTLKYMPPLNWLIVGNNNVPRGWRYVGSRADEIDHWVTFTGNEESTDLPIPRLYRRVGIMTMRAAEIDDMQAEYGGQHAVALRFGAEMLVGALAEGQKFNLWSDKDGDRYGALLRIGRGDATATAGLWVPDSGEWHGPEEIETLPQLPANLNYPRSTVIV